MPLKSTILRIHRALPCAPGTTSPGGDSCPPYGLQRQGEQRHRSGLHARPTRELPPGQPLDYKAWIEAVPHWPHLYQQWPSAFSDGEWQRSRRHPEHGKDTRPVSECKRKCTASYLCKRWRWCSTARWSRPPTRRALTSTYGPIKAAGWQHAAKVRSRLSIGPPTKGYSATLHRFTSSRAFAHAGESTKRAHIAGSNRPPGGMGYTQSEMSIPRSSTKVLGAYKTSAYSLR